MKKLIVIAVALLGLALFAGCNEPSASSGGGVAVVDSAQVFQQCDAGKAGIAMLQQVSQQLQDEARGAQAAMEGGSEQGAAQFQMAIARFQQVMGAEQQRIYTLINDAYQETLDAYRQENGLIVILDLQGAVSYDEAADITQKMIQAMNGQTIDLGEPSIPPLPEMAPAVEEPAVEEPAAPAEPAAEAPAEGEAAGSDTAQ